jgi:hypothetical protein
MDPRRFALVFQQEEVPSEGAVFPLEAIESCYDSTRRVGQVPQGCHVVVGIDPAASHYTAGVAIAVGPATGLRLGVDVWNEKNLTGDGGTVTRGLSSSSSSCAAPIAPRPSASRRTTCRP